MSIIRDYIFLYRLSDGPKNFVMSCFLNRWLNPFRYHMCDYCEHIVLKHSIFAGIWHKIMRKPWYCGRCAYALEHTRSCHRAYCADCDIAHWYLAKQDTKSTAARLLREAGFDRVALSVPEREGGWS